MPSSLTTLFIVEVTEVDYCNKWRETEKWSWKVVCYSHFRVLCITSSISIATKIQNNTARQGHIFLAQLIKLEWGRETWQECKLLGLKDLKQTILSICLLEVWGQDLTTVISLSSIHTNKIEGCLTRGDNIILQRTQKIHWHNMPSMEAFILVLQGWSSKGL